MTLLLKMYFQPSSCDLCFVACIYVPLYHNKCHPTENKKFELMLTGRAKKSLKPPILAFKVIQVH